MRRNRTSHSRAPFYLLVLCIGLASIVYWQTERPPSLPTNVAGTDGPPEAEPTGALQAEFTFPPLAAFSEIVARPLFSPSRQPPKEIEDSDSDTAVTPPTMPSHFILAGVVISAEERMVLLRRMNSTDVIRASMGQEIDGWYIELIEPDRVTLRRGNTVEIVTLQEKVEDISAQRRLRVMQNGQLGANQPQQ
jgi:general secretion pathway protein N